MFMTETPFQVKFPGVEIAIKRLPSGLGQGVES